MIYVVHPCEPSALLVAMRRGHGLVMGAHPPYHKIRGYGARAAWLLTWRSVRLAWPRTIKDPWYWPGLGTLAHEQMTARELPYQVPAWMCAPFSAGKE